MKIDAAIAPTTVRSFTSHDDFGSSIEVGRRLMEFLHWTVGQSPWWPLEVWCREVPLSLHHLRDFAVGSGSEGDGGWCLGCACGGMVPASAPVVRPMSGAARRMRGSRVAVHPRRVEVAPTGDGGEGGAGDGGEGAGGGGFEAATIGIGWVLAPCGRLGAARGWRLSVFGTG